MSDKFSINLEKRPDKDGKTYYIGRLKAPVLIDCKEGTTFFIFISEEGEEEMQICGFQPKLSDKRFSSQ